jgi:division protein CdvB (Snf7/Vps24/ESCRT-III family)
MNEIQKLETRAKVLMRHIETNSKKIRQTKLMNEIWDIRRIEATLRTMYELRNLAQMINELWEHPEREILVGE